MESFFVKVIKTPFWKKMYYSFLLGALSVLAFPNFYAVGVLWVAFPSVLFLQDSVESHKKSFFIGYAFGAGMFVFSMYWLYHPLTLMDYQFSWLIPFALIGVGLWGGFYTALAFLVVSFFKGRFLKIMVLSLSWGVFEYIRSNFLFGGIAWNTLATVWTGNMQVAQISAFIGTYALSILTVLMVSLPFIMTRTSVAISIGILLCLSIFGHFRIFHNPTQYQEGVLLRLVQANISQEMKHSQEQRQQMLTEQVILSNSYDRNKVTHIIWAESAVPYVWQTKINDGMFSVVSSDISVNSYLITGIVRFEDDRIFNSLVVVDKEGKIEGFYDKSHLVPFGEYIPFAEYLPIQKIVPGQKDFSASMQVGTLPIHGLGKAGVLICYEIIFSGKVTDRNDPPDFLLNITNDKWFGDTHAPYQHYANAILRAIEEGIPVIRSANSGISAVIDPVGREIAKLDVGIKSYMDSKMPLKLEKITLFNEYGNNILYFIILFMVLLIIFLRIKENGIKKY